MGANETRERRSRAQPAPNLALLLTALLLGASCDRGVERRTTRSDGETAETTASASSDSMMLVFEANDPHAFCRSDDCGGTPLIQVRRADAPEPLLLSAGACPVRCSSCTASPCQKPRCTPMGVAVTREEFAWDGTYFEPGFCNGTTPCVTERVAAPGRYVAELCASRGARTNDSIGAPVCIESGERSCAKREFNFPSSGTLVTRF